MGTMKGIETEKSVARSKSTKKQRADANRQRELWDQEHAAEKVFLNLNADNFCSFLRNECAK